MMEVVPVQFLGIMTPTGETLTGNWRLVAAVDVWRGKMGLVRPAGARTVGDRRAR